MCAVCGDILVYVLTFLIPCVQQMVGRQSRMRRFAPGARRCPPSLFPLGFLLFTLFNLCSLTSGAETITPDEPVRDPDTLDSAGGRFRLGFFSPGGGRRYLGIWYGNIPGQTVVWVANREIPINGSGGVVELTRDGRLALYDVDRRAIWSSNSSSGSPGGSRPVARLLDTGNLVVREGDGGDAGSILWQSFDYPTDTLLPEMKLGRDLRTGMDRYLVSWRASDDPSPGDYSYSLDLRGLPQLVIATRSKKIHRIGPWNGAHLSGVPEMNANGNEYFTFEFVSNETEVYYTYRLKSSAVMSRLVMNSSGAVERFVWLNQHWSLYWWGPNEQCDSYDECGDNGVCGAGDMQVCSCPEGFRPRSEREWGWRDWSGGCERETPPDCRGGGDDFLTMALMKLPDAEESIVDRRMGMGECREACRSNCTCMAFAAADIRDGSGCIMWVGNLTDLRQYPEGGQELYLRVAASVLGDRRGGKNGGDQHNRKKVAAIVSVAVAALLGFLLLGFVGRCVWKRKAKTNRGEEAHHSPHDIDNLFGLTKKKHEASGGEVKMPFSFDSSFLAVVGHAVGGEDFSSRSTTKRDDLELPLFGFGDVAAATNNFSSENKIGEGGFGPVYKGELEDGRGIAVKRLSRRSEQGVDEFRNEVSCIAQLQHRNLVRLLGCCIEGEERILVYEYMHNKSLASIIFDKERSALLNWKQRFSIIVGIARGLLYLHQDSRLRIVHRDLKASNILLDEEMNPKISDFGTARIFSGDKEDAANTRKVVGTYGYMSPEYAMDGVFSVKTDVFSFGVLIIEIISGKRNKGFYYDDSYLNLVLLAWRLWNEGSCRELLAEAMGDLYSAEEVTRCIQVGLLCVQERAEDRPTMTVVVQMLGGTSPALPPPRQPGFSMERSPRVHTGSPSSGIEESRTVNHVTVTMLQGR